MEIKSELHGIMHIQRQRPNNSPHLVKPPDHHAQEANNPFRNPSLRLLSAHSWSGCLCCFEEWSNALCTSRWRRPHVLGLQLFARKQEWEERSPRCPKGQSRKCGVIWLYRRWAKSLHPRFAATVRYWTCPVYIYMHTYQCPNVQNGQCANISKPWTLNIADILIPTLPSSCTIENACSNISKPRTFQKDQPTQLHTLFKYVSHIAWIQGC